MRWQFPGNIAGELMLLRMNENALKHAYYRKWETSSRDLIIAALAILISSTSE